MGLAHEVTQRWLTQRLGRPGRCFRWNLPDNQIMSRVTYYANRGRMTHERWCGWDLCALTRCHGDRPRRSVKRGAKIQWGKQIANDVADMHDAFTEDAMPDYCGEWCPCGANYTNWVDFLTWCEAYPPPPLRVPLLDLAA